MKATLDLGMNRTGMGNAPLRAARMKECSELTQVVPRRGMTLDHVRAEFIRHSPAVGSVPIPTSLSGLASAAGEVMRGKHPAILVDKLGERLAFERTGTRLYEQLRTKARAHGDCPKHLLEVINRNHEEERNHVHELSLALTDLGADPTAMVPGADTAGVTAMGLLSAMGDPRVDLAGSLEVILVAELVDEDAWKTLIEVARAFRMNEVEKFERARDDEERHLVDIRAWAQRLLFERAGIERGGEFEKAAS